MRNEYTKKPSPCTGSHYKPQLSSLVSYRSSGNSRFGVWHIGSSEPLILPHLQINTVLPIFSFPESPILDSTEPLLNCTPSSNLLFSSIYYHGQSFQNIFLPNGKETLLTSPNSSKVKLSN